MPCKAFMCPHRQFRDDDDQLWSAWDVIPSWGERRRGERRVGTGAPPRHTGERRRMERRQHRGIRIALTPHLADGWLVFESGTARRRLVPIPPEWSVLPDEDLKRLWHDAEHLPARRRRLIE